MPKTIFLVDDSASEELTATAEEMGGQAEQLQDLMKFFRLNESNLR